MSKYIIPLEFPVSDLRLHANIQQMPRELRHYFVIPAPQHIDTSYFNSEVINQASTAVTVQNFEFVRFRYEMKEGTRCKIASFRLHLTLEDILVHHRITKDFQSFNLDAFLNLVHESFLSVSYPFYTYSLSYDEITYLKKLAISGNTNELHRLLTQTRRSAQTYGRMQYMFSKQLKIDPTKEVQLCQKQLQ